VKTKGVRYNSIFVRNAGHLKTLRKQSQEEDDPAFFTAMASSGYIANMPMLCAIETQHVCVSKNQAVPFSFVGHYVSMFPWLCSLSKLCIDRSSPTIVENPASPPTPPRNICEESTKAEAARDTKKRQADNMRHKMENMRLAKRTKEGEIALRRQLFPEDFSEPEGSDIFSVPDSTVMLHAMKRMDEGWKKIKVIECSGSSHQRITRYHEVWKACDNLDPARFSLTEKLKNQEERFKFHCDNMKPGRRFCEPLTKLDIKDTVAKIVGSGNSQLLNTQIDAFTNAVLPNLANEHAGKNLNTLAGAKLLFQRSEAAVRRLIHNIIPVYKENAKKHVQSRTDARNNPVGAFSFVAMFPQLVRNVHISNVVCIDTVSTELFGEANKGVWMTQEVSDDLKMRRQAPKASDSGGQYRSFKISLAIAKGQEALVNAVGIVADHEIPCIERVNITPNIDIIFSPYCAKDESDAAPAAGAGGIARDSATDSLSKRLAGAMYDCHIPRILQRRIRMQDWAQANGHVEPALFRYVRVLQDGDSGPLKIIMECLALNNRLHAVLFGKLPNGQTNNCQTNDMAAIHPIIHSAKNGYSSPSFKTMSEERVQSAVVMYPGLKKALEKLESYGGMSRNGKMSYRYAIAFLPSLLARAVTPAIVNDAFELAGYDPYDPAKMMHNMWSTFKELSEAEAREALRIAEGPLREISEQRGLIWAEEVVSAIQESDVLGPVIELPQIPEHSELKRWNMQSTMDLSHDEVQQLHDARIAAAENAQRVQAAADADAEESKRRLFLRFAECEQSRDVEAVTGKITIKCKCGGKWSNGISGFKNHEDGARHKLQFPHDSWEGLYSAAANRADQPMLVENVGAGAASDFLGNLAEVDDSQAEGVQEELAYFNAGGYAGYMNALERAELAEYFATGNVDSNQLEENGSCAVDMMPSQGVLPAPSVRRPIGFGLTIPEGWFSADQRA
jgi:hypothetical protein